MRDQHGQTVRLSALCAEVPVVVFFYPFAFSSTCTQELQALRQEVLRDEGPHDGAVHETGGPPGLRGVQMLAISCDPVHSLRAFSDAHDLPFPLLSDFWPHGEVSRAYGVFSAATGAAVRGTFALDGDRVVRWSSVNAPGQARTLGDLRRAVAAVGT